MIIAVDGLASSGKSTLAKELAAKLNYRYIDSGAFYRAVTLYFQTNNLNWKDEEVLKKNLMQIQISFEHDTSANESKTFLNGKNVEAEIRSMIISDLVSEVSTVALVRSFINDQLRFHTDEKGIVMDGRDIGTVVFPGAEIKFFVTADEKIRSERRFLEMKTKGEKVTENEIMQNLSGRDFIDSTRSIAPLKKAHDAIILDTTYLNQEEQLSFVLKLVKEKAQPNDYRK